MCLIIIIIIIIIIIGYRRRLYRRPTTDNYCKCMTLITVMFTSQSIKQREFVVYNAIDVARNAASAS